MDCVWTVSGLETERRLRLDCARTGNRKRTVSELSADWKQKADCGWTARGLET